MIFILNVCEFESAFSYSDVNFGASLKDVSVAGPAEEEECKEKIVTATKKGAAVLDLWLPDHIKTQYHVLQLVIYPKNDKILLVATCYLILTVNSKSYICLEEVTTNMEGILSSTVKK